MIVVTDSNVNIINESSVQLPFFLPFCTILWRVGGNGILENDIIVPFMTVKYA